MAALASIPIILILALMVGFRWPATRTMPIAWISAVLLAAFVWQTPSNYLLASSIKGLNSALEILLIVFGAMVLLFTLREAGALESINRGFRNISRDRRVQAILICWLFGAFLEGAAGFGVPAALLSPLLVSLGFPPLAAVTVSLIANATPVSFGPVGVPTLIGIGTPLNSPAVLSDLATHGLSFAQFIHLVGFWTAVLHAAAALFVPLLAVSLMTRYFGARRSFRDGLRIWRFALFCGAAFVIPYLLTAWFLGPEFPSLFGGLVGLAIALPAAKTGFLLPKDVWEFPAPSEWEKNWTGSENQQPVPGGAHVRLWKAWLPYVLVGALLVLTRVDALPFKAILKSYPIAMNDLFGTHVKTSLEPFYNPGVLPFILMGLLCVPMFGMKKRQVLVAWQESLHRLKAPAIALLFTVPMVEVMQAGQSPLGYESMPIAIAQYVSHLVGSAWPMVSPFVGAFGAFIAGSNTVSNLLFGVLQYAVAARLHISHIIVLSLQNAGGSFGVLVCVFKIIAACATVGLSGLEGAIIRRNALPLVLYGLVVGTVGTILIYTVGSSLF
ncbi:MAG TPA: L-lactate permease [Bacteroidota bacterium]|nr:L-lactate permease [Bacteroidota bacterium]